MSTDFHPTHRITFARQSRTMLLRRGLTLCAGCTTELRAQTRE